MAKNSSAAEVTFHDNCKYYQFVSLNNMNYLIGHYQILKANPHKIKNHWQIIFHVFKSYPDIFTI